MNKFIKYHKIFSAGQKIFFKFYFKKFHFFLRRDLSLHFSPCAYLLFHISINPKRAKGEQKSRLNAVGWNHFYIIFLLFVKSWENNKYTYRKKWYVPFCKREKKIIQDAREIWELSLAILAINIKMKQKSDSRAFIGI